MHDGRVVGQFEKLPSVARPESSKGVEMNLAWRPRPSSTQAVPLKLPHYRRSLLTSAFGFARTRTDCYSRFPTNRVFVNGRGADIDLVVQRRANAFLKLGRKLGWDQRRFAAPAHQQFSMFPDGEPALEANWSHLTLNKAMALWCHEYWG